jgi:hypothetical protein
VTLILTTDLTVREGEVRVFNQSDPNFIYATAVMVGWFESIEGERYHEPSIVNYGEIHLGSTLSGSASLLRFSGSLAWDYGIFENYGLISAIAPADDYDVRALFADARSPHVYNAGTIVARAMTSAIGFESWDFSAPVTNAPGGIITAQAGERAAALYFTSGGTVINHGTLRAHVTGGGPKRFPMRPLPWSWAAGTSSECRFSTAD